MKNRSKLVIRLFLVYKFKSDFVKLFLYLLFLKFHFFKLKQNAEDNAKILLLIFNILNKDIRLKNRI